MKAYANFHCFGEDDGVFRASWNVAMVERASHRAMAVVTVWSNLRIASEDQSASDAEPITLET